MAFYGESYEFDVAKNVTGTAVDDFGDAIRKHFDADSMTVTVGDAFMVGAFVDPTEPPVPDDAVVSWVIETGPASSGTLRVSSGLDPDFNVNDPATAGEALGDFTVSGTQTVVAGPTSLPLPVLLDQSQEPVVFIECIAGTVEILQVKLRVWPAGGPAGQWVSGAAFESPGPFLQYATSATFDTDDVHGLDPAQAQAEGKARLLGYVGSSVEASTATFAPATGGWDLGVGSAFWNLTFGSFLGYFVTAGVNTATLGWVNPGPVSYLGPEAAGLAGLDPREIPDEGQVRGPGGGPLGTPTFSHWEGYVASGDGMWVGGNDTSDPGASDLGGGLWLVPFRMPGSMVAGTVDLTGITSPWLVVGGMPPEYFDDSPTEGFVAGGNVGVNDFAAIMIVPAYEWFNPGLPWVDETQRDPRFFVTVRDQYDGADETLRERSVAVGIGKPPTEPYLFKVPTPLGTYRELRYGEKISDVSIAHPLKVKLADDSWTVVAYMTPDA